MADWFKFYENDLDETRLQYAIAKLPEVVPVWVGILSECCRHKASTISWGKDEIELFGFSRRLNISIPKVNEAVNLLREIRYISTQDDHISVIKWAKKQSEYCQKKTMQQNQTGDANPIARRESTSDTLPTVSRHTPDSVPTHSRQYPDSVGQEEKRGEERRGDTTTKLPAISPTKPKKLSMGQIWTAQRLEKALGASWVNDAGKWINRVKEQTKKAERVCAEVESAIKEGRVATSPAAFAEDTWKRFN